MGGASIGGSLIASHAAGAAARAASMRSPEERQLFDQQRQQSQQLFGAGMPGIQNALGYYRTLLSGSRSARTALAAPEAEDVSQASQGAETTINNRLRGGERDQALAENARQRAGQIARLVTGRRGEGAAGIASLAPGMVGAGAAGTMGLLNNSTQNRMGGFNFGAGVGQNFSNNLGALLARLYDSGAFGGKGFKAPGPLPSRQTVPNYSTWMPE